MAITDLGSVGTATTKSSGTTLSITASQDIPAGTLLVLAITFDNPSGTTTAPTITPSASGGGSWTQRGSTTGSGVTTSAGSGIWAAVFTCKTTTLISSGSTITTVTLSASVVAEAVAIEGFTGVLDTLRNTVVSGSNTGGSPSATTSGTALVSGDLVVGTIHGETNSTPSADTDTTNGSWDSVVGVASAGGQAATNVAVGIQDKVVTATGAQTYNATTSNDSVAFVFALQPDLSQILSPSGVGSSESFGSPTVTGGATPTSDLSNSCEGTSGTAVSISNSGGPNQFDGLVGTPAYDNTHVAHGSTSIEFGPSNVSYVIWQASITSAKANFYTRAYLWMDALPTANSLVINLVTSAGAAVGKIQITTAGAWRIVNGAGGITATGTITVPTGQWVRFELDATGISGTTGTLTGRIYTTADSNSPDETIGASGQTVNDLVSRVWFGPNASNSNAMWIDDVAVSYSAPVGPAGSPVTTLSPGGIASAEGFGTPTIGGSVTLSLTAVSSAEVFGTTSVNTGGGQQTSTPTGIATAETFGTSVTTGGASSKTLSPTAISGVEAFGTSTITIPHFIVVVADMQPGSSTTAPPTIVAAQIVALSPQPELVIIPGDCTNHGDQNGFSGEFANFNSMYGSIKSILRPVPGNHDWGASPPTGNLTAYDTYWGAQAHSGNTPPHFYSFDVGNWHIIGLDSDEEWIGSLNNPSATYTAVVNDLAANSGKKIIAFWHHARWSDGTNATDPGGTNDTLVVQDIWNALYDAGADIVFGGHTHSYQRFPKFGKTGSVDSRGIRSFVIGSGGSGLFTLNSTQRSTVNSYQATAYDNLNSKWFGYLKVWLYDDHYDWAFISQNAVGSENPGATLDSGTEPSNLNGNIVLVSGISSAEALGTPTLAVPITCSPSGIASSESVSNTIVSTTVNTSPTGISTAEVFGAVSVAGLVTLSPNEVGSGEAPGTPALSVPFTLAPLGVASAEAFGNLTISLVSGLSPAGITTGESFGTPILNVPITIPLTGVGSSETFGTAVLSAAIVLSPSGVISAEALGTPLLSTVISLIVNGISSAEAEGTPSLTMVIVAGANGIISSELFGTAVLSRVVTSQPIAIGSGEFLGTPLIGGANNTAAISITSSESFGIAVIGGQVSVNPSGVVTQETFGVLLVSSRISSAPLGISGSEVFGNLSISSINGILPSGISSIENFGAIVVIPGSLTLSPVSVASGFAAGTPVISAGVLFLVPSGIGSAETVSSVALSLLEILSAVGITSAVAVGIPAVETGVVTLLVVGINSGEQFGNIQLFTVEISKPSAENTRTTVADRIRQGVGISGRGGVTAAKPVGSGRSEVHSV